MWVLIFEQILKYFFMMMLGFLFVRWKLLKSEDSRVLSILSMYLILPCAILSSFQAQATSENMLGLVLSFGTAAGIHVILILATNVFGKIFHMCAEEKTSLIYSNAANMILPLITSVLGEEWTLYACPYMSVQLILLWSHGKMMICQEKKIDLKKIISNVNIIAIILGLFLFLTGLRLPGVVSDTCSMVGNMLAPASMIVIGMVLGGTDLKAVFCSKRVYFVCLFRLVVLPGLVLAAMYLALPFIHVENAEILLFISFLSTTTAVSSTVMQMVQVFGKDAEYASEINVMSTILCLITMTLMTGLYEWLIPLGI